MSEQNKALMSRIIEELWNKKNPAVDWPALRRELRGAHARGCSPGPRRSTATL